MLADLKEVVLIASLIILALCLILCFIRTLIGPSIPDRIEMKIVECTQYNYRFCWIIGSGKTPIEYAESYF